jgi:hypothetical protein
VGSERCSLVGPSSLLSPRAVISAGPDAVTHCPVEQGKKAGGGTENGDTKISRRMWRKGGTESLTFPWPGKDEGGPSRGPENSI